MKPMLAGKYEAAKVEKKLPLLAQVKYDGIRVFIRDGIAYTRSLKAVRSEQFQSWVAHNKGNLEGLDGEAICGDPTALDCYRRTSSSIMSFNKPDEFTFYAFDKWDEPTVFADRFDQVNKIGDIGLESLTVAPTFLIESMEELDWYLTEKIAQGHEGLILRDPMAFYKYGRGSPVKCECIKLKEGRWVDTEGRITALQEELENANEATLDNLGHTERSGHKENLIPKGRLGSVTVSGKFEDGRAFEVRIGTGFDHETRQDVWNYREDFIGRIVKFKYFDSGIKDKPRFPVFLGFRDPDDMDPEQLDLF